jgi:hypothetical protein
MRVALPILFSALVGCTQPAPRYLTAEQDAEMRAYCEPAGCEIVPTPMWRQIEQIIRRVLGGAGV